MNKLTNKENGDRLIDSRMTAIWGWGRVGSGGSEQKEKGLMDMDDSVVIGEGKEVLGD